MNAEYINLVERKKKLGTNIGALDFYYQFIRRKLIFNIKLAFKR